MRSLLWIAGFRSAKFLSPERIERIVVSAMKQSHKAKMPKVNRLVPFKDFIARPEICGEKYIAHCLNEEVCGELSGKPAADSPRCFLPAVMGNDSKVVLIGPGRRFRSRRGKSRARAVDFIPVSLGGKPFAHRDGGRLILRDVDEPEKFQTKRGFQMNVMYRFLGIWLLVACALCFTSCGKAYYNVIPESSPAIASFDFTQMASEAGEDVKALTDILPLKSGIDFSQPAYGFISPNGYYGVVVAVDDEDDLAREIQKSHDFSAVDRSSDLHWALWKSNWQLAWNDEALLMLGPVVAGEQSFMRRTVSAMFNSSKGIDRSPLFESLEKQGGNAKMVARLSCLPALLRGMLALQCSGSVDADSVILECSCIIADGGQIVMDNELKTTDGGNPAKASGLKQYNGGMSGERLAGNTKAFMLMGMDGEKFAERLGSEKSAKGLFAVLKSTTVMGKVIAAIRGDALFFT